MALISSLLASLPFIFRLNPELEIRVKDESGFEVHKSKVDKSLEASKVNSITGFVENTTVTFEKIIL